MIACAVVIPARWASSRFPGKVVATLAGKPLVLHACELASRATNVDQIIVATDDERVVSLVQRAGYQAVMTRPDHPSGTDRVAEVMAESSAPAVIGLQADEPFLEPSDLDRLAQTVLHDEECRLATLCSPLDGLREYLDPNVVKVVLDSADRALYFSRSPIPYQRPIGAGQLPATPEKLPPQGLCRKHIGVYAWQRDALLQFPSMPPSPMERCEGLEQLRALEAGWTIRVLPAAGEPFGVDTPEDLHRAELKWARGNAV